MRCATSVGAWAEQPRHTSKKRMKVRLHNVTRNRLIIGDCLHYLTRSMLWRGCPRPRRRPSIRLLPLTAAPDSPGEIPAPNRSYLPEAVNSSSPNESPPDQGLQI